MAVIFKKFVAKFALFSMKNWLGFILKIAASLTKMLLKWVNFY